MFFCGGQDVATPNCKLARDDPPARSVRPFGGPSNSSASSSIVGCAGEKWRFCARHCKGHMPLFVSDLATLFSGIKRRMRV